MSKAAFLPIIFLFLFAGTRIKYEHSQNGSVALTNIPHNQKPTGRAKCQLDYTITNDTLIVGRFQIIDPPSEWNITHDGTFRGVITRVNSPISFGRGIKRIYPVIGNVQTYPDSNNPPASFEWETRCFFNSLPRTIQISKTKGDDHFIGKVELENKSELSFYLE